MSLLDVLSDRDRREQQESLRDAVDRRMKEFTPLDRLALVEEIETMRQENAALKKRLADEIEHRLIMAKRFADIIKE